jgi:hypothetical protein
MRFRLGLAFTLMVGAVMGNATAYAQSCSGGYARSERSQILAVLPAARPILNRMAGLAQLSASSTVSNPMRYAMFNEFYAWRNILTSYGNNPRPWLSARAQNFIGDLIDAENLGLNAITSFVGDSEAESQELSQNALDAVNNATGALSVCFATSWDQLSFMAVDSANCFGGFNQVNLSIVKSRARAALSVLNNLSKQAQAGMQAVDGPLDRQQRQAAFAFVREEIKIIGSEMIPLLAGNQSAQFIQAIFDPASLQIDSATLAGQTIQEAQANSAAALASVGGAKKLIRSCVPGL